MSQEPAVRLRDGIEIDLATGETVICDASRPDGDTTVVSHAHGDHLPSEPAAAACWSPLTRDLAAIRREFETVPSIADEPHVELVDSGHVPGSRAALIEDRDRTVLYTGDVCTRDRFFLSGFEPPSADVLIVESTYGEPEYAFPPIAEERAAFGDWLARNADRPVVCFGYAFGRAQEIELLLQATDERDRVFASPAIRELDAAIEAACDVTFESEGYEQSVELGAGDALVLPSGTSGFGWVESLVEDTGAVTAGFSGWAVDSSYKFANGFDETFVCSDHCDFAELIDLVRAVDPEVVYTHHGSVSTLARHLTTEYGYRTRALERNQTSLADF